MFHDIVRIGYQGENGSNSLSAAIKIVEGHEFGTCDFLGLVSSLQVVDSLVHGFCDYGVVAIRNSYAGEVSETLEALRDAPVRIIDQTSISVSHCLFKLPEVSLKDITHVASHPQALAQTRNTRKRTFPNPIEEPMPDTAISARWLREGVIPATTAVICSMEAGSLYNLELISAGIQDASDNHTDFVLIERA